MESTGWTGSRPTGPRPRFASPEAHRARSAPQCPESRQRLSTACHPAKVNLQQPTHAQPRATEASFTSADLLKRCQNISAAARLAHRTDLHPVNLIDQRRVRSDPFAPDAITIDTTTARATAETSGMGPLAIAPRAIPFISDQISGDGIARISTMLSPTTSLGQTCVESSKAFPVNRRFVQSLGATLRVWINHLPLTRTTSSTPRPTAATRGAGSTPAAPPNTVIQ